jgi:hypothetical protein
MGLHSNGNSEFQGAKNAYENSSSVWIIRFQSFKVLCVNCSVCGKSNDMRGRRHSVRIWDVPSLILMALPSLSRKIREKSTKVSHSGNILLFHSS